MKKSILILILFFIYALDTQAQQLCEGNLGANIFSDGDFGSGTDNVLLTDPSIAPGYTYQPSPFTPPDGSYVITNNTAGWSFHYPSWLTMTDNSEDPNGYFMLVNASFDSGLFYSNVVSGLCENTFYEFSADIINVIRQNTDSHIFPNVSFLIDDVEVFTTGNILQNETWNKYGFTFTTGLGQTELKLSLRNNAEGGRGNDLALDNISFQPCGPDAFVSAEQTIFLCADATSPAEITADISSGNQSIIWQTSSDSITWIDIPGADAYTIFHDDYTIGKYYYRYISANSIVEIVNDFCNIISDVLLVEVVPLEYNVPKTICFDETYMFGTQLLSSPGIYVESFISSASCDSIVTLDLSILEEEVINFNPIEIDPSCYEFADGSLELIVTDGALGPYNYSIGDTPSFNNNFQGLAAGTYNIEVINQDGCIHYHQGTLVNPPKFEIYLPSDTIIDLGESLDISITSNDPIQSYTWSTDELLPYSNLPNFSFTPILSQTHTALATNSAGCTDEESFTVSINIEDLNIYFPNLINYTSRDGNQLFTIGAKPNLITNVIDASIYDRWGNLVDLRQNTSDLNLWDGRIEGKEAEQGVYVYLVVLELLDGNVYMFNGELNLIK